MPTFELVKNPQRNEIWDILKGIGIFAVVVGHSGCPKPLLCFISAFHMPLFFIISGILLNDLYFENKSFFVKKRIKSLYIPFVKWSIIFILLHNLFFNLGVINSLYGYAGDVDRLYSVYDIAYSLMVSLISMNTFEHLLGALWFIKALFVGSILFVFLGPKIILKNRLFPGIVSILILFFCVINIIVINHFPLINFCEIRFVGHNEFFATFFISLGFLIKQYIHHLRGLKICVVSGFFLLIISQLGEVSMAPMMKNVLLLPVSAIGGFVLFFNVSCLLEKRHNWLVNLLKCMGRYSFYILLLHFLCFKVVSYFKVWLYDLDVAMVAEFPVISLHNEYFWILYSLVGVLISLKLGKIIERIPFLRR